MQTEIERSGRGIEVTLIPESIGLNSDSIAIFPVKISAGEETSGKGVLVNYRVELQAGQTKTHLDRFLSIQIWRSL